MTRRRRDRIQTVRGTVVGAYRDPDERCMRVAVTTADGTYLEVSPDRRGRALAERLYEDVEVRAAVTWELTGSWSLRVIDFEVVDSVDLDDGWGEVSHLSPTTVVLPSDDDDESYRSRSSC